LNWRQFLLERFFAGRLACLSGRRVRPSPAAIFALPPEKDGQDHRGTQAEIDCRPGVRWAARRGGPPRVGLGQRPGLSCQTRLPWCCSSLPISRLRSGRPWSQLRHPILIALGLHFAHRSSHHIWSPRHAGAARPPAAKSGHKPMRDRPRWIRQRLCQIPRRQLVHPCNGQPLQLSNGITRRVVAGDGITHFLPKLARSSLFWRDSTVELPRIGPRSDQFRNSSYSPVRLTAYYEKTCGEVPLFRVSPKRGIYIGVLLTWRCRRENGHTRMY
jgi:hypothetical protein